MKIVVKIGTQALMHEDSMLPSVFQSIVEQLALLQMQQHQTILVSSGAVGYGRDIARQLLGKSYGTSIGHKQVLASLGQHELMGLYAALFKKHRILVSQILLTKQDLQTRKHYLNIYRLLNEVLANKHIIPIINENDSVAIEELMFTDNDELAGLIAAQINADKLIILSNVEGVYTSHPNDPQTELLSVIDPEVGWPSISSAKSTHGRGGMISKLSTARKMSSLGITTHIASIQQEAILQRLLRQEKVGTTILPAKRKSNIKRWMAYNSQTNGLIRVNRCLHELIKENKRILSILPVGIEHCHGDFNKGDIVSIVSPDNKEIGLGMAQYNSNKLKELLGQKNKAAFIHYDYLHIF